MATSKPTTTGDNLNANIRRMYVDKGMSVHDISRSLMVRWYDVRERLAGMGYPYSVRAVVSNNLIKQMYLVDKLTMKQIGDRLGVSHITIRGRLITMGISRRCRAGRRVRRRAGSGAGRRSGAG